MPTPPNTVKALAAILLADQNRQQSEGKPIGGRTFGGRTFGGNTFGGNTYGGNTFGASAQPPALPPIPQGRAQNPYPEAGTVQAPMFAQNPYPESGTQQPGGTPPFAPPSVQAALAPPSMPLVPPGALPPAQPQGLDPATFPSTSSIDQKITPNLGSGDMLEQWRRMMDQAQWARQGG